MFSEDIDHKCVKIVFPHESHFPQKSLICQLEYQTLKMLKYFLFEFVDFHNNSNKKIESVFLLTKKRYFRKKAPSYPANIHLFKVNNSNTTKRCEICSKLTIKTSEPVKFF